MTEEPVRLGIVGCGGMGRRHRAGLAELARCVRGGTLPEVDGEMGRRDVVLVYALFESQLARWPVTIAEVESGAVDADQREIDEHLVLVAADDRAGRAS